MFQDHSDHGASKEPTNPLWVRDRSFFMSMGGGWWDLGGGGHEKKMALKGGGYQKN